ncbi:MAG: TOBE domain-containing protein [Gammaproteobacteria bacterium]|nr:TOBE domain-containing protein [Gammaproteobacteria bacterium]MBU1439848.1 TOBE domain-containing protein [Gammaproteobacteria bacterium]
MASPRFGDALGHGMSDKRIDILRGIARSGSISQAARDASVSYKAAWQAVATLTNLAGVPLVARAVGGSGGGGASLTAHGVQLLDMADALDAARRVVQAQGAASGAGTAAARLAGRTSMRNQLPVVVSAIETAGRVVRVVMDIGGRQRIAARITRESTELLGLAEGLPAIALCKATAVRIEAAASSRGGAGSARRRTGNRIEGVVVGVARDAGGDEITMALEEGLRVVGFAEHSAGLRGRQRVVASVDEAGVVVALPG